MSAGTVVAVQFADGEYIAIPTSGHCAALLTECAAGGWVAICWCSTFAVIRDTEAEVVTLLDAHIAGAVA